VVFFAQKASFDGGLAFIRGKNSLGIFSWVMGVFWYLAAIDTNKR
jgi:hypothetical protein